MDNIYRGEPILKEEFINKLSELKKTLEEDLLLTPLMPEVVIEALHTLSEEVNEPEIVLQLAALGIPTWSAQEYVRVTVKSLSKKELIKKVQRELGEKPFQWKSTEEGIEEKEYPLGVILHIGAGNTLGLSAFSVIEGLLTGNINILKLPQEEGGISSMLLRRLVEIEPRLKPYIYVIDVSSKDSKVINELIEMANAVVVWGSEDTVKAIREIAPPSLPIIEWGHRLSFAYFTNQKEEALKDLAMEICITDQLYCSSPQCVFYESDNIKDLEDFANKLSKHIEDAARQYPQPNIPIDIQAQITWTHQMVFMEEVLSEKRLITDKESRYGVMVAYKAELKPSPLFRNIWVMPIKREDLMSLLRSHKGYLQTAGLSCNEEDFQELANIFYAAGVNRITSCGYMSKNYSGEPHDGAYALSKYVRKINKRKIK